MKLLTTGLMLGLMTSQAYARGELPVARTVVKTAYQRLASVPPAAAQLETWAQEFVDAKDAAAEQAVLVKVATDAVTLDTFYSRTVLNFAEPETNEGEQLTDALNDHTALIVGMIRDGVDYRQILYGDVYYIPNPALALTNENGDPVQYSFDNNDVYDALHRQAKQGLVPLASSLMPVAQSTQTNFPIQAGMFTTRGYASVFYNDGTNRAPVRYTFMHYICRDMELLSDITRPDIYIRRDVDRTPGGDGEKFRTECAGCHTGMDPHSKAFSYLDYNAEDGVVTYTPGEPVVKVNRNNDTFPNGYVVEDDTWLNIWYEGSNSNLGWNPEMKSGNGPKSWGESIATTSMFPECMAQRVYETVCLKEELDSRDRANLRKLAQSFEADSYNMKNLFINASAACAVNLVK